MKRWSFWGGKEASNENELPEIYPLSLKLDVFIEADLQATYAKILTDVVERTHGIPKKVEPLLWDNCVKSETTEGLITLLSKAMVKKSELFLVYKAALGTLREADQTEKEKIRQDYATSNKSETGVYISFKNYRKTDMLLIYSALEYCVLASFHKTVNISKAVQIKMSNMRSSTALNDSAIVIAQAQGVAAALRKGLDILIDKEDDITNAVPNIEPTEKAISFIDAKRSFILGLPIAYITGLQTPGIGSTGEADSRAVDRGLKSFFVSIVKPVLEALFDIADAVYESEDFRQITTALEVAKTFELISDETLSAESKQKIIVRVFGVDLDEEIAAQKRAAAAEDDVPRTDTRVDATDDEDDAA